MPLKINFSRMFSFSSPVFFLALVLNGCVNMQAQQESEEVKEKCKKEMFSHPASLLLKGKIPLASIDDMTPDMLSIADIPTDQEVEAIKALIPIKQECQTNIISLVRKYQPNMVYTFEAAKYKNDLLLAALMEKKMSYGNANRLAKEAYLESLNLLTEQIQKEMAQARQLELQRAQVLMHGAALIQQAQPIPPSPRLGTTNCRWVGNTLNCTSF